MLINTKCITISADWQRLHTTKNPSNINKISHAIFPIGGYEVFKLTYAPHLMPVDAFNASRFVTFFSGAAIRLLLFCYIFLILINILYCILFIHLTYFK